MSEAAAPAISVVVVTDRAETLAEVIGYLRAQTIHERVELVVPTPKPADTGFADLDDGELAEVTVVQVESVTPIAIARAAGVRAAAAPYVFVGETHSFPAPDMLERLVDAHRAGWDRVAPVFANANPSNALSWAAFLLDYGRYAAPADSGEAQAPIYNCSYARASLEALEPLDRLIESGSTLNDDLAAAGCRPYRQGEAAIAHVNVARLAPFLGQRYLIGRNLASRLARRWPVWRRALYVVGAPFLPPVLAFRTLRADGMRARLCAAPRLTLAALLLGLVARAAGEAVGYAAGAGRSEAALDEMEIHKLRYT